MKKNLFDNYDLIGFSEITNEKELISTLDVIQVDSMLNMNILMAIM